MQNQILENALMEMQAKDSMKMYNGLVERCFHSCVNDFTSRGLKDKERKCVLNCTDKYIKYTNKV